MAKFLRLVAALQILRVVSGTRRADAASGNLQQFPLNNGVNAVGAVVGHGLQSGGRNALAPRASWMPAPLRPVDIAMRAVSSPFDNLPKNWGYNLVDFEELGRDEDAIVYKANLRKNPEMSFAVKRMKPETATKVKRVANEVELLEKFKDSPGIVTMFRTANVEKLAPGQEVLLLLERADGNLNDMVFEKTFAEVPIESRIKLFADIVRAVRDMEEAGVAHRNLTPENILVMGDCSDPAHCCAVLCDFANAYYIPDGTATQVPQSNADGAGPGGWDYQALASILFRLITVSRRDADAPRAHDENLVALEGHDAEFDDYEHSLHTLGGLVITLQTMLEHADQFSTKQVFEALQDLAKEENIDLTPREVPRVKGWSYVRSFFRTLLPSER